MSREGVRTDIPICIWPGGWEGNLRHAVVDNIITNRSMTHILLVWRSEAEIEGGKWALPGGYVDPGDTVVGTVHNETSQVTGQRLGALALFRIVDNPHRRNEQVGDISFVFASNVEDPDTYGEFMVDDPDRGVTKARWFELADFPPEEATAFDHYQIVMAYRDDPATYPLDLFISS